MVLTCLNCLDKTDENVFGSESNFEDKDGVTVAVRFSETVKLRVCFWTIVLAGLTLNTGTRATAHDYYLTQYFTVYLYTWHQVYAHSIICPKILTSRRTWNKPSTALRIEH